MKQILIKTIKWLGALVVLLAVWIGVNSIDSPDFSDPPELKKLTAVLPENNGYEVVKFMDEDSYKSYSNSDSRDLREHIQNNKWNQNFVNNLLSKNIYLIEAVLQSNTKELFQFPLIYDPTVMLPSFQYQVEAWRTVILKAKNEFKNQNYNSSIVMTEQALLYAVRIGNEEGAGLVAHMIGIVLISVSLDWIHEMASVAMLTDKDLEKLHQLVAQIPDYKNDNFSKIFVREYHFIKYITKEITGLSLSERTGRFYESVKTWEKYNKDYVEGGEIDEHDWEKPGFMDYLSVVYPYYDMHPNEVLENQTSNYIAFKNQASVYCADLDIPRPDEFDEEGGNIIEYILPNTQTREVIHYFADWQPYYERRCLFHSYRDSIKAVIAIQRYKLANDDYPVELSDLIPAYLESQPLDYFTGKSLLYSSGEEWLYFVGMNYTDDGGSEDGRYVPQCNRDDGCKNNPTIFINWKNPEIKEK